MQAVAIVPCPACKNSFDIDLSMPGEFECPHCRRHVVISEPGGQGMPLQETSASQRFFASSSKFLGFSLTVMVVSFFIAFATNNQWTGESVPVIGELSVIVFFIALPVTGLAAVVFLVTLMWRGLDVVIGR